MLGRELLAVVTIGLILLVLVRVVRKKWTRRPRLSPGIET